MRTYSRPGRKCGLEPAELRAGSASRKKLNRHQAEVSGKKKIFQTTKKAEDLQELWPIAIRFAEAGVS